MRIKDEQIKLLKNTLQNLSQSAKLYLFGSRVDDNKKGGDIDLLVVSDNLNKKDLSRLRIDFYQKFGEQKIDIVLDDGKFKNPFNRLAKKQAVLL
ncbi:MAG: nucleotidyltransferase domain-containing protein [Gammaproteobacteria bacterium]|nr:MAG: nucleotidyltransferase domain-containing protein [Gammaproteobacteria bacterium]